MLTSLTNVNCFGESSGNVEVEATGTGPFAFSVNGEASQISASEFWSLNDTVAGTYDFSG